MIFFSIGIPGHLADWCDALIAKLIERSSRSVEIVALRTFDEVAAAAIRSSGAHIIGSCRQPVLRLQTEIAGASRPFVVAVGDPRAGLRDLTQRLGYDLPGATREVASSCAAVLSLTAAPNALVLSETSVRDPVAAAAAIAGHFTLPLAEEEVAATVAALAQAGLTPDGGSDSSWWDQLDTRDQALVNGALTAYAGYTVGSKLEPIVWQPELFFAGGSQPDQPPLPVNGPIDITGRARFLVFGPYINLPPGSWSANVVLGFSAEAAGMTFVIEVYAGMVLANTRVTPSAEQIIEANLHFTIDASASSAVEIRIFTERAAFEGRLALGYVELISLATVPGETQEYLTQLLRN
jgi:hypothetical protein